MARVLTKKDLALALRHEGKTYPEMAIVLGVTPSQLRKWFGFDEQKGDKMELTLIETHNENGVEWGLSTNGPNPEACDYLKCESKQHALRIKSSYERGDIMPFLEASGAVVDTE